MVKSADQSRAHTIAHAPSGTLGLTQLRWRGHLSRRYRSSSREKCPSMIARSLLLGKISGGEATNINCPSVSMRGRSELGSAETTILLLRCLRDIEKESPQCSSRRRTALTHSVTRRVVLLAVRRLATRPACTRNCPVKGSVVAEPPATGHAW